MDHKPGTPSYSQFLEYRAVIIQAIASSWHDPQFRQQLVQHPKEALHRRFDYTFPFNMNLHVTVNSANWTPATNGGWTTVENNTLELILPPAPPADQATVALAAYNARNIDFFDDNQSNNVHARG